MAAPVPTPRLTDPASSRARTWWRWLLGTLFGRLLLLGLLIKLPAWTIGSAAGGLPAVLRPIDAAGSLGIILAAAVALLRLTAWIRRRFLWRVRRKLILSYVFVGVVPVLLLVSFFLLAGLLLLFTVSSYLVTSRLQSLADQAQFLAQMTAAELQPSPSPDAFGETLERRVASLAVRYPFVSLAVVPAGGRACPAPSGRPARAQRPVTGALPRAAGPWAHVDAPVMLPRWVPCGGFSGLLAYDVPGDTGRPAHTGLTVRAVAFPELAAPGWAVVLDLPLSGAMQQRIAEETGIHIGEVGRQWFGSRAPGQFLDGRALEPLATDLNGRDEAALAAPRWFAVVDHTDWATGTASGATVTMRIDAVAFYQRLSAAAAGAGEMNLGRILVAVLGIVGGLFLVIQVVALLIGLLLARQITGAVHDLFTGTQHLRNRDLAHTIPVRAPDQLGELAESFNAMTGEVRTLLGEVAEKGRLEQEMHAARDIQQKLLPPAPHDIPGLSLAAFCEPAREVAGDYYDFLPITARTLGILIADVSGKGLAAGLYMAQLKVIVQSLAMLHHAPREFLVAVNEVVARNLDPKSFITMTYGVVDLDRREMTFARAGHCPLIHVPATGPEGHRSAQVLAPDGLVVGLQIDDGRMFRAMLEERTVPLGPGDVVVLFTDGISETMNEAFDCYGEGRLSSMLEQHGHLPFDQLRARLLAELRAFAGTADQHDDMTMIMMRVG